MYGYKRLYINGKLRDAKNNKKKDVISPATEEVIGQVAWAGKDDALDALKAAKDSYDIWSVAPLEERISWMKKLREVVIKNEALLRECVMNENGKTYEQAEEDYITVVNALHFYGEEMLRMRGEILPDLGGNFEHKLVYTSLGVVAAFIAWNFPLLNLGFKLGPALASGCPLILRPSTDTPLSAYLIGEMCAEVGMPAGVVNIIAGSTEEVANTIVSSNIPSMLTLIGSTETGKKIINNSTTSIKHYSMELGGNAPVLVFEDADLDKAANTVSTLKFANTGQICVTPNRVFVQKSVYNEFAKKIVERAKNVRIGHGRDSRATMGPLINQQARERVDSWIKEALKSGAKLLYGGKVPDGFTKGFYYEPTVLSEVEDGMVVSCDEIFGPVISLKSFSNIDEVIRRANDTEAGLASYIFSNSIHTINTVSRELRFGEVMVNGVKYNIDLPHGGIKQSGIGHDCSHLSLREYLSIKRISIAL